eukprot:CAMPEP_0202691102 /NCGR_PEP_ID=MMETSP1385-20130828/5907_1 /ASSEMBLY_ACC=CAM_ASM_000861 /TAXON_ID=933848 /ORGANISM="Elphidium margaritaceum" /LENGTH=696 /DNA_ID=CAMNT_0049346453 /DNA_START=62 /DNA_END=2152 /DNA_ORIENTATION=+
MPSTGNKVLDELLHIMVARFENLVECGYLAPHFLTRMISDPKEIIEFLRSNRTVVAAQLERKLDPRIRMSPQQLEKKCIVPQGYFTAGHEQAIAKRHRRRSTAGQDLAMMIQLRPKPQDIIDRGIVKRNDMNQYIDVDDEKQQSRRDFDDDGDNGGGDKVALALDNDEDDLDDLDAMDEYQRVQVYQISVLSTLLFKTIQEALKKSCHDTARQEAAVLVEMTEMNEEMRQLRNTLDKYFLSANPDIAAIQAEEDKVREKFHGIQQKLLHISTKQNTIHEKLKILHSVERSMVELQNEYDAKLGELKQNEEKLLKSLIERKTRRDKAVKVVKAEQSHHDWATAKLSYTIELAQQQQSVTDAAAAEDAQFVEHLQLFLQNLKRISSDQKQIVAQYAEDIERADSKLLRIRHDMGKVRTMTFKKIYDLHKQVQIAESLDLGLPNRRLSVASATELEREQRHHSTKIQRQLITLNNQIKEEITQRVVARYEADLDEIVDVQLVMSDAKLKAFFCVFVQIFNQTLCDVELMYRNLNHNKQTTTIRNGVTTNDHLQKITKLCQSLYGIHSVINKIDSHATQLSLNEKLSKCVQFISILKYAISKQYKVKKVATHRCNTIGVYIARKLCVHEVMLGGDEIEKTHDQQIPRLAEIRSSDIFQAIIGDQQIFPGKKLPKTIKQAAHKILENVFGIQPQHENAYIY